MLSKISINGFKSIENAEINLKPLTLFVGMNSSGKSTAVQSLLLAIQNITEEKASPINGDLVSIGEFNEATNFRSNSKEIKITLQSSDSNEFCLRIFENENQIAKCESSGDRSIKDYLNKKNKRIQYLSSDRLGAQDIYLKNYSTNEKYGTLGEYTMHYFETHKKDVIQDVLIRNSEIGVTLEIQVNFWLNYIINAGLSTEDINGTDKVKAKFSITGNRQVRPKNIGTGLSYLISIIVSILSSKTGDLLIIENPEIHLHPKAQSRLTELFAFAAKNGVRFIIETHSDHIFNGIRKAINNRSIDREDLAVYYFEINNEYMTIPTLINFSGNGNVVNHQSGLFDQFDDDIDELLGL